MKVTIVVHHIGPLGGMERQCTELAEGYLAAGWSVTVVARECILPRHPRLRFVHVGGPQRPFSVGFPWFFVVGGYLAWRHRDGLLHVNGAIIPNRADVATVHFAHRAYARLNEPRLGSRATRRHALNARIVGVLVRAAERWCYRPSRITHLICISHGVWQEVIDLYPYRTEEITIIPYGVDRELFRRQEQAREAVRREIFGDGAHVAMMALFVGGDWGRKGLHTIIEALARAPEWHLVVVGDGDEETARARAQASGVGRRVHFLGRRALPADVYSAADAFCLPTLYETFCLVAHEAAAAGLPLLVTRVSGVEDLLRDGENGWFIKRDEADVAARLEQLRCDPVRARKMGEAARHSSEPYSWAAAVRAHLALYELLMPPVSG